MTQLIRDHQKTKNSMKPLPNSDVRFWTDNVAHGIYCKFKLYKGKIVNSFYVIFISIINAYYSYIVSRDTSILFHFSVGHVSQDEIDTGNASLIAQDDSVKREYMAKGVRRIEIKVTSIHYVLCVQ